VAWCLGFLFICFWGVGLEGGWGGAGVLGEKGLRVRMRVGEGLMCGAVFCLRVCGCWVGDGGSCLAMCGLLQFAFELLKARAVTMFTGTNCVDR